MLILRLRLCRQCGFTQRRCGDGAQASRKGRGHGCVSGNRVRTNGQNQLGPVLITGRSTGASLVPFLNLNCVKKIIIQLEVRVVVAFLTSD